MAELDGSRVIGLPGCPVAKAGISCNVMPDKDFRAEQTDVASEEDEGLAFRARSQSLEVAFYRIRSRCGLCSAVLGQRLCFATRHGAKMRDGRPPDTGRVFH